MMFKPLALAMALALPMAIASPMLAQNNSQNGQNSQNSSQNNHQSKKQNSGSSQGQSQNSQASAKKLPYGDQQFLQKIAREDAAELKLAHLAMQKSTNPQVKAYAQTILQADPAMAARAKTVAKKGKASITETPNAEGQAEYSKLAKLSGKQFDKQYMSYEAQRQKKDLTLVQNKLSTAKNPKVRQYAQREQPPISKAATKAQQLNAKLMSGQSSQMAQSQ